MYDVCHDLELFLVGYHIFFVFKCDVVQNNKGVCDVFVEGHIAAVGQSHEIFCCLCLCLLRLVSDV